MAVSNFTVSPNPFRLGKSGVNMFTLQFEGDVPPAVTCMVAGSAIGPNTPTNTPINIEADGTRRLLANIDVARAGDIVFSVSDADNVVMSVVPVAKAGGWLEWPSQLWRTRWGRVAVYALAVLLIVPCVGPSLLHFWKDGSWIGSPWLLQGWGATTSTSSDPMIAQIERLKAQQKEAELRRAQMPPKYVVFWRKTWGWDNDTPRLRRVSLPYSGVHRVPQKRGQMGRGGPVRRTAIQYGSARGAPHPLQALEREKGGSGNPLTGRLYRVGRRSHGGGPGPAASGAI
jgi:hypothetical protein